MYLRETHQKRADGTVLTHLQLAESVWNPQKERSEIRIVYNCGRADDPEVVERLRRLARSILRRCSPEESVAQGDNCLTLRKQRRRSGGRGRRPRRRESGGRREDL